MSDDFHRPTLTFEYDVYSATQVRLYGISAKNSFMKHDQEASTANVTIHEPNAPESDEEKDLVEKISEYLKANRKKPIEELMREIINGILGPYPFSIPVPIGLSSKLALELKPAGIVVVSTYARLHEKMYTAGVIVGYSFEGHCYDLPKPKIMLIPAPPSEIPDDDCGYDLKKGENYRVWIVDKLDECVELEMNQGFVEQLVLEANLPGRRSPTMYAGKMLMGHRSGRLSEQ